MKKTFGHPKEPAAVAGDVLLAPQDLPTVGVHYSPGHLRRLVHRGEFPKPIHLSPRRIGWRRSTIMKWIASKAKARA
jgi:predicted DNA-binding transcriptional regulator AlpA